MIDAHQHVWAPSQELYTWLGSAPETLRTEFTPAHLEAEMHSAGVTGGVLIQAANTFEDTRAMLRHADRHPWVLGVVGWVPLSEPAIAALALDQLSSHVRFKGVRHLIHDEPDPDYLVRPAVIAGLAELERRDFPFDVVSVLDRHLAHVPTVARQRPALRMVIDHLGKPPIRERGWEPWASLLRRAGEHENVYAKISGLTTSAEWDRWTAADLHPYIDHALDCFGARRLMFGGDWPVATLTGTYADFVNVTREVISHYSAEEQRWIQGRAAQKFYRL